jgi:hypothetical protein
MPLNKIRATKQIRGDGNSIHYLGGDSQFHDMPAVMIEDLSSQVNGATAHFTVSTEIVTGSLRVYVNGVREPVSIVSGVDGNDLGFTLTDAPPSGSKLIVDYNDIALVDTITLIDYKFQTLAEADPIQWDLSEGNAEVTLTANRNLATPTNLVAGSVNFLTIHQDGVGSRTISPSNDYKFPNGIMVPLTITASGVDIMEFMNDGTYMYNINTVRNLRDRILTPADLANNVLWYDFGLLDLPENQQVSSVTDLSPAANNGTSGNGPWIRNDHLNGRTALIVNGNNYIQPNSTIVHSNGTYIILWQAGSDAQDYVLSNDSDHSFTWDGSHHWLCGNSSTQILSYHPDPTVYAVSFDGSTIRRYIDGVAQATESNSVGVNIKYIAGDNNSKGGYGYFYEVAVYSRVLSAQEITDLTAYIRNKWGI